MTGALSGWIDLPGGVSVRVRLAATQEDWAQVRNGLEPLWRATHESWPDPMPDPLSRFMCRYTAEYVRLLDSGWNVVLGRVDGQNHCWSEHKGMFLDLTGDQFGRPPVQFRRGLPVGYMPFPWTNSPSVSYRARATRWFEDQR